MARTNPSVRIHLRVLPDGLCLKVMKQAFYLDLHFLDVEAGGPDGAARFFFEHFWHCAAKDTIFDS
jgi:hypothetical protein